ncbi:MAG: tetratricopeptide repeat protein [Pseudomonadota bacterium]|nr:tetratricopeptide repeat protein [Pseudomonadota bacterium]
MGDPGAIAAVGDLRAALGDYAKAFACYDRAVNLAPNEPSFWFNRAAVRRILGQLADAESDYDRCLSLDPSDALAYLNRTELRVQTETRNHIEQLERVVAHGFSSWTAEVPIRYALAKEYEDLERYTESWRQLRVGATLRRRHLQYDPVPDLATVDWLIESFPADGRRAPRSGNTGPIFIVGMPRTGSTLVDRMLGSHRQVHSAGELVDFGNAVVAAASRRLGRTSTRRELIAASAKIDYAALGADYLARTGPRSGVKARFTDKLPLNYLYCGLIVAALPNARIVHVTRHPLATCYGAYKVLFDQGYPFSYDLKELADYYVAYRRLMAHWQTILPRDIIEINYERLVADPEGECRRLLTALDLEWDAGCLKFHENPSPTATASATQVRRPVYTKAVAHWRNFSTELNPVRERLVAGGVPVD